MPIVESALYTASKHTHCGSTYNTHTHSLTLAARFSKHSRISRSVVVYELARVLSACVRACVFCIARSSATTAIKEFPLSPHEHLLHSHRLQQSQPSTHRRRVRACVRVHGLNYTSRITRHPHTYKYTYIHHGANRSTAEMLLHCRAAAAAAADDVRRGRTVAGGVR